MTSEPPLSLAEGLRRLGLGYDELWMRYVTLGGAGSLDELRGHIESRNCPDDHDHNIIAQTLNDAFVEQGGDHPVGYQHLYEPDAGGAD